MNNFVLHEINKENLLLVCLDHNSFIAYVPEMQDDEHIQSNEGNLIIDQLLVTGDGNNRFLLCGFSHGRISLNEAQVISHEDTREYRKISSRILNNNFNMLEYSILTDKQLEMIHNGDVV